MPITLENKLGNLIHEIQEIKKELILHKVQKVATAQNKINTWDNLGERVSSKWDTISAVEEISRQREKS